MKRSAWGVLDAVADLLHVGCVAAALALVPYLLEAKTSQERIALGAGIAFVTRGTLWGVKPRKD